MNDEDDDWMSTNTDNTHPSPGGIVDIMKMMNELGLDTIKKGTMYDLQSLYEPDSDLSDLVDDDEKS